VTAVNQALTKPERIEALKLALATFSHNNTKLHDYEIQLGADKALCLKLGYVIMTCLSPLEELQLIGDCLRHTYLCSTKQRELSFRRIGGSDLAPLLVQVLVNGLSAEENITPDVLTTVVEILRIYAKLESAKSVLVRMGKGLWLGQILKYCVDGTVGAKANKVSPLCMELLGLIKDLSFRSSASDKETMLSLREGVFGGLIASICKAGETADRRLVDWFTAVMWNLVLDKPLCDQILALDKAHNFPIIGYLLRILNERQFNLAPGKSDAAKIRRNAISCIGNMLSHMDNQLLLLRDQEANGSNILRSLVSTVENDTDSIVRRRAMRALRCIACSEEIEVLSNLNHYDLQGLSFRVISRRIAEDDENDRDMQIQACHVISASMDRFSCAEWPQLETILQQRIETSNDEKLIHAACSCLVECIKHSPCRKGPSCFSDLFWTRLEVAAASSAEPHLPISSLLMELARWEEESSESNTDEHPSNLTNAVAVKIIIHLISIASEENFEIRRNALDTVRYLATRKASRRALAENERLLSALVNLCLLEPDITSKDAAKKIIIDLVPEI
jgi:hypothetical protein